MGGNFYGDRHLQSAALCCERCGRPFAKNYNGVEIDGDTVSFGGKSVKMTPRKVEIVAALARSFGHTVHRDVLMDKVWGDSDVNPHIIAVYTCGINKKLKHIGLKIFSSWSVGNYLDFLDAHGVVSVNKQQQNTEQDAVNGN